MVNEYYVYAYYLKSTNEIFYIGKGIGNRYKNTNASRNIYFINILNKYKDDVDVKILYGNLTEQEAFKLEYQLIHEYWEINQCKANIHEGGCGGNTGNYEQVATSLSKYYATHKRSDNWYKSMKIVGNNKKGKVHSSQTRQKQSESAKKSWEDISTLGNQRRLENLDKFKFKKGNIPSNKGLPMKQETYIKMMNADCKFKYEVYFNGKLIYWTISSQKLEEYCKETFNISRTIIYQIINNTWIPKFNKHKYLSTLKIIRLDRSVSTNRDECSDVEWRLQPFEVPGNLNK